MPSDFAIHSDLLVHWTGRDIDCAYDPDWYDEISPPKDSDGLANAYLHRLWSILKFGLWMTIERPTDLKFIAYTDDTRGVRDGARVCFTELKLSQSRTHAKRYGRLGIGVKRRYLFDRGGRPVIYYAPCSQGRDKWVTQDVFLQECRRSMADNSLLHYFKEMGEIDSRVNYRFYEESEWRVVHHRGLSQAVDPKEMTGRDWTAYRAGLNDHQRQSLKYLLPLDLWFSAIIYPTLPIKHQAQNPRTKNGKRIRNAIREVKDRSAASHPVESKNWPVEIDIGLCRNL